MQNEELEQDETVLEQSEAVDAGEGETEEPVPVSPQPDPLFREVWFDGVPDCDSLVVSMTVWTQRAEYYLGDDGQWYEGEWLLYIADEVLRPATMDECPTSAVEPPVEESWPEIGDPLVIEAPELAEVESVPVAEVEVQAGPELLAETGGETDGVALIVVGAALILGSALVGASRWRSGKSE